MKHEAAWSRARAKFEAGYGCTLDLTDETDVGVFLPMLAEEIERDMGRALAATIQAATERMRGELAELKGAA